MSKRTRTLWAKYRVLQIAAGDPLGEAICRPEAVVGRAAARGVELTRRADAALRRPAL